MAWILEGRDFLVVNVTELMSWRAVGVVGFSPAQVFLIIEEGSPWKGSLEV